MTRFKIDFYKVKMAFLITAFLVSGGGLVLSNFVTTNASVTTASTVENWWPTDTASITGTQPFQAIVANTPLSNYDMYWSVDDGTANLMQDSADGYPHKRADVTVTGWNWQPSNSYKITFIAKTKTGLELGRKSIQVIVPTATASTTINSSTGQTATTNTPLPVASTTTSLSSTAVEPTPTKLPKISSRTAAPALNFYTDPNSQAKQAADSLRATRPTDAAMLDKIANSPTARWFGGWNTNLQTDVNNYVSAAQGTVPVLVAYNIPQRDCGSYSAGGASSGQSYLAWIQAMANGIAGRDAWVILEPDAVPGLDCLVASDQSSRLALLSQAVSILKSSAKTRVYIDAGNARWHNATVTADRLTAANIASADGFSLNVSNFIASSENVTFGQAVASKLNGKHFVIDTSRNGNGAATNSEWCNPDGRALGSQPTSVTNNRLVDAFLWIKAPGESDGTCNGGPAAGVWWTDFALGLARRASY